MKGKSFCVGIKPNFFNYLRLAVPVGLAMIFSGSVFADKPCEGNGSSMGIAQVFFPNPVATLQDQTLTDQNDENYDALNDAYQIVVLTNLDGSGYLRGDFANIKTSVGKLACSENNVFIFDRSDDRFEQVMAYYWITESQKYIQSLGFNNINNHPQVVQINQWGIDNSAIFNPTFMKLGKGGVDDAEDAEVVLHEYGHNILESQVPSANPGNSFFEYSKVPEFGSIHEGFADYWAVSVAERMASSDDPPCVADWDSVSYTSTEPHCLRRLDANLHYPEDAFASSGTGKTKPSVHGVGRIWSQALYDIRSAIGSYKADTLILSAHFDFYPGITFVPAANAILDKAESLVGTLLTEDDVDAVRQSFIDRGILEP